MNDLERQLDQAGAAHRNTRYPGDLADDIAARVDMVRPSHSGKTAAIGRVGFLGHWRVAAALLITTGVVAVTLWALADRNQPFAHVDRTGQADTQPDGTSVVDGTEANASVIDRRRLPIQVSRSSEHRPRGLTRGFGLIPRPVDRSLVRVATSRADEARSTVAGRSFYDRLDLRRPQRPQQKHDRTVPAAPPSQITPPTPGASAYPLTSENNT